MVSQIAFSLLLLIGAGLFVQTLKNLERVNMGFQHEGVLLATFDPWHAGYEDARVVRLCEDLLQTIDNVPGVGSASLSVNTPLSGGIWSDPVLIDGQAPQRASRQTAHFNSVSPGFFATMRTPLLRGRDFSRSDDATSQHVAIVNEQFVRTFFKAGDALGHRLTSLDSPQLQNMQIVGVVKNTISFDLREPPPPFVYVPYSQSLNGAREVTFEVRARGSMTRVADAIRSEIHKRLPDTALTVRPFTKQVQDSLVQERLMATLAGFFGLVALALAAVGLYGLVAYSVTRRTSEIGVRVALGASRGDILSLVLRGALILGCGGVVVGLPIALATSRLVAKMLFGIRPADPGTASMAAALLVAAALLAAVIPARRASSVAPLTALRYQSCTPKARSIGNRRAFDLTETIRFRVGASCDCACAPRLLSCGVFHLVSGRTSAA
jgi:predicted permease